MVRFWYGSNVVDSVGVVIGEWVGDACKGVLETRKIFVFDMYGLYMRGKRRVFERMEVAGALVGKHEIPCSNNWVMYGFLYDWI